MKAAFSWRLQFCFVCVGAGCHNRRQARARLTLSVLWFLVSTRQQEQNKSNRERGRKRVREQQTNEQIFYICFAAKAEAKNKSKSIAKYLIWHSRGKLQRVVVWKRRGVGGLALCTAAAALGAGIPCWIRSSTSASTNMYLGLSENCICMSIALVYLALLFLTLPKHTRSQADRQTENECSWIWMCGWFDSSDIMEIFSRVRHSAY